MTPQTKIQWAKEFSGAVNNYSVSGLDKPLLGTDTNCYRRTQIIIKELLHNGSFIAMGAVMREGKRRKQHWIKIVTLLVRVT